MRDGPRGFRRLQGPADGKLVFRDPTVTVQRDGEEAVEMRPRKFVKRWEVSTQVGRAVDATVDPRYSLVELLTVIGISSFHMFILANATMLPLYCEYTGCGVFLFKGSKKRSGTPKLVFKLPEVNWPDLDALAPESPGACTMQFRTPCDEDAEVGRP